MDTGPSDAFDEHAEAWRQFVQQGHTRNLLAVAASRLGKRARWMTPRVLVSAAKLAVRAPTFGRPDRCSYVIRLAGQRQVADASHALQRRLRSPYFWPVPDRALHVTVLGLDHLGGLSAGRQAALVAAGQRVLDDVAPFTLHVGNATGTFAAVAWEVNDGGAIRAIRARLWAAIPWLLERRPDPYMRGGQDTFRPHLSVGYFTAAVDNRPVVDVLRRFRPHHVAEMAVQHIELVRVPILSFDQTVVATFPLHG